MIRKLLMAAAALSAFAAFACVPAVTGASRKTEVNDSAEFGDLTNEWNLMNHIDMTSHEKACELTHIHSRNETRNNLSNCYIGDVAKTVQLTGHETHTGEVESRTHNSPIVNGSEYVNPTVGTYEVTHLKERLA